MVIIGARGLAKEVLEIFFQHDQTDNLYFFDNVSKDLPNHLFQKFPILTSIEEVNQAIKVTGDHSFTLGLGNPSARYKLTQLFEKTGGLLTSTVSKHALIGHFGNVIGPGCTILDGAVITNGVTLGKGCLINPHGSISHDSRLGDFVEMSPGARVTGSCTIGDFCVLGTNAVVLPNVTLGRNVIVGAGAVVTKDVPDNSLVVGIPGLIKKTLPPLSFLN